MLKRLIDLPKFSSDDSSCHYETVPDYAAISACNAACDAQIRGIKQTITECEKEISEYEALESNINSKLNEANNLAACFNIGNEMMASSNINGDFTGCNNCLNQLVSTYNNMLQDCSTQKTNWNNKKTEAESALAQAEADKAQCATLTKTVLVC